MRSVRGEKERRPGADEAGMRAALSDRSSRRDNVTSARMGQTIANRCARSGQNSRCTTSIRWRLRRRRAERLCQECWRARALLGRRGTPWQRQRMGTLDAPGAKTPFQCGGGGGRWAGLARASPRASRGGECGRQRSVAVITPKFVDGSRICHI